MIIEIGERVVPDRGDKGDQGYPGMNFKNSEYTRMRDIFVRHQ